MKKTEKYIQDFRDTFGEKYSREASFAFTQQLKNIGKKAFPSQEYKDNLSVRLKNMYLVGEGENIPARFSARQLFGAIGSFCFISLTLFGVYIFYSDTSHIKKYSENEEVIQLQKQDFADNVAQESQKQKTQRKTQEEIPAQKMMTRSIPRPSSADKSMENQESSSYSSENSQNNQEIQNPEVFPEEISTFLADQFLSDDMMMQAEDSEAIHDIQMQEFYKICEENEGNILDDDYSCEFESGEICTVDTISPESLEPCKYLYSNKKEE